MPGGLVVLGAAPCRHRPRRDWATRAPARAAERPAPSPAPAQPARRLDRLLRRRAPQLPLSLGNSVFATDDVLHHYHGGAARRVTPARLCLSLGLVNVGSGLLGGMALCHGSGGATAHYRLGARTAGATLAAAGLYASLAAGAGSRPLAAVRPGRRARRHAALRGRRALPAPDRPRPAPTTSPAPCSIAIVALVDRATSRSASWSAGGLRRSSGRRCAHSACAGRAHRTLAPAAAARRRTPADRRARPKPATARGPVTVLGQSPAPTSRSPASSSPAAAAAAPASTSATSSSGGARCCSATSPSCAASSPRCRLARRRARPSTSATPAVGDRRRRLAGRVAARRHRHRPRTLRQPVFVMAVDLARPGRGACARVLAAFPGHDAALPVVGPHHEPLFAAYGPACLAPMTALLEAGRHRIIDILPEVAVARVRFADDALFRNINTMDDYQSSARARRPTRRRPAAGDAPARPGGHRRQERLRQDHPDREARSPSSSGSGCASARSSTTRTASRSTTPARTRGGTARPAPSPTPSPRRSGSRSSRGSRRDAARRDRPALLRRLRPRRRGGLQAQRAAPRRALPRRRRPRRAAVRPGRGHRTGHRRALCATSTPSASTTPPAWRASCAASRLDSLRQLLSRTAGLRPCAGPAASPAAPAQPPRRRPPTCRPWRPQPPPVHLTGSTPEITCP